MGADGIKFSYIVTVYNSGRFLKECLNSLLNQSYKMYEIIIVDDGSDDGSEIICDEYEKMYSNKIKVIHQKNQGQIVSRLNGIDYTSGEYICFIDSDDLVDRNQLEYVKKILEKNDIDIIVYSYRIIFENGKKYFRETEAEFQEGTVSKDAYMQKWFDSSTLNPLWRKIIRKELLKYVPENFRKRIYVGGDFFISLPVVCNAKSFYYLDKELLLYRINPFSISNNYKKYTWRTSEIVREAEYKYFKEYFGDSEEFREKFFLRQMADIWGTVRKITVRYKKNNERVVYLKELRGFPLVAGMENFCQKWNGKHIEKKALRQFFAGNWNKLFFWIWVYDHTTYNYIMFINWLKKIYSYIRI